MNPDRLIDSYLDGDITPAELARLDAWIRADASHARQFARRGVLHSSIDEQLRHTTESARPRRAPSWVGRVWQWFVQPTPASLVVSGAVVAALLVALAMWTVPQFRPGRFGEVAPPRVVAKITGTRRAVWNRASAASAAQVPLHSGETLHLDSGWAEIAFGDGAVVLLQGPAELQVNHAGAATLQRGKLTARVPLEAIGFVIRTPLAQVKDLGTEFGVAVADRGATDVSVFVGRVELSVREESQQLTAGGSAQVRQADGKIVLTTGTAGDSEFARTLPAPLELRDVLAIDFNDRQAAGGTATATGFQEFVLGPDASPTGHEFGSLRVTVSATADALDDRRRETPVAQFRFTDSELLRDFVFGPREPGETLQARIEGLKPEQLYQLTLWSFDTGTQGKEFESHWSVGQQVIREAYRFNGARLPVTNADCRIVATCLTDAAGELIVTGRHVSPAGHYGVFLNALRIRELYQPVSAASPPQTKNLEPTE